MAKWSIPDNRDKKRIEELEEILRVYVETDDPADFDLIKRRAQALLKKGGPR